MRSFILISALVLGFAAVAMPADAGGVRMFVRHDVSDYLTWRKVYNDFDATRRKLGASTYGVVYQSAENPNDITVYHDFKSLEKAKAFAASAELKAAMQNAGVKGSPQIWFATETSGRSGKASNVRMFVRHQVSDYTTWRRKYDEFDATRRKMGVAAQAVYQSTDDPNDITVYHDFRSLETAKGFAASPELKSAMQNAGVQGTPQIWFAIRAEK